MQSLGIGINMSKGGRVISNPLASLCAYVLDGVDRDIVLNGFEITDYLTGASKQFAINVILKRGAIGTKEAIFSSSDNSLSIYFTASNEIQIEHYDTAVLKSATTVSTFTSTSVDYFISVVYDGATSKILVNGVDETLTANTLTATIDTTINDYYIGSNGSTLHLNAELKQFSINDGLEVLAEHTTWIENKVSPSSIFSNIVKLLNTDSDPKYDRVNNDFALIDSANPSITNRTFTLGGATNEISIPDNAALNTVTEGAFSVFAIVKFNSIISLRVLLGKMSTSTVGSFYLGTNTTQLRASVIEGGLTRTLRTNTGKVVVGEWMKITYVLDGASSRIYIDAVNNTAFNNATGFADATSDDYTIGRAPSQAPTVGDCGYIQIVDKAVSQAEVTEWYNSGNPINVSSTSFSANLAYTFNASDYRWNGFSYIGTDSASGLVGTSIITSVETNLHYGGLNIAQTRNVGEFNKVCNGIASKGEQVDVIFWSGQSNAYGKEILSNLQTEYTRQRDDIQIWKGNIQKYNPIDGTTAVGYPSGATSVFGAQYSFGYKYADYYNRYLFLNQYAIAGTILNLEPTHLDWNTASTGEYFDDQTAENVLEDAELANNHVWYVCEVWNQHESDCDVEARANNYEVNLTNYINKRRVTYPNLKFIIPLVHADLPIGDYPYKLIVKAAQISVAATLPNVFTLDQDSASSDMVTLPGVHRDAAGYEELGRLIFEKIKII